MLEKANNIKRSNTNSKSETVCCLLLSTHRGETTQPGEEMARRSHPSAMGARDGAAWLRLGEGSRELCPPGPGHSRAVLPRGECALGEKQQGQGRARCALLWPVGDRSLHGVCEAGQWVWGCPSAHRRWQGKGPAQLSLGCVPLNLVSG